MHLVGEFQLVQEQLLITEDARQLLESARQHRKLVIHGGQHTRLATMRGRLLQRVRAHQRALQVPDEHPIERVRLLLDGLLLAAAPLSGHHDWLL